MNRPASPMLLLIALVSATAAQADFLTRQGAQLLLSGKPFAAVGVNKQELIDQYIARLLGASDEEASRARAAAQKSLAAL
ncbi:MAG: hypothetical protein H5T86_01910, partial [Armatimonadetes bacterium]|nr:hypothetical protein [Armatimonadota bacterium]